MKTAIIGPGAWGKTIGGVLERNGHTVAYIGREAKKWPKNCARPDFIFLALPCQVIRQRLSALEIPPAPIVSLTKGIEIQSGLRVTQILKQILPQHPAAVLSGPNLAAEVSKQMPTATVVTSEDEALAKKTQQLLHQKYFRVYRSADMTGVELGGALKNIYAIAGGICTGLKLGENSLAGLLTRSLAEMIRIACALGAKKETLFGLSGMGDLMLTAYSGLSRNHQLGEALAAGEKCEEAVAHITGVAEGAPTTQAVRQIAQKKNIQAPILGEVYNVLYQQKSPTSALHDLLVREMKEE